MSHFLFKEKKRTKIINDRIKVLLLPVGCPPHWLNRHWEIGKTKLSIKLYRKLFYWYDRTKQRRRRLHDWRGGIRDDLLVYTFNLCGDCSFLLVFGDIFDFDGPIDLILIVPWLTFYQPVWVFRRTLNRIRFAVSIDFKWGDCNCFSVFAQFLCPNADENAESTLSASEKTLEGQMAIVVTPIPLKGMGRSN